MTQTAVPNPIIYVPVSSQPKQLFLLLHGASSNPGQLESLTQAIKRAFPQAMIILPYGTVSDSQDGYSWFDLSGLDESNYIERVQAALPALIAYIQQVQAKYGLTGEHTALAGFDHGATIALEASLAQPDLAGRVLAFSGCYAQLPGMAPPATTLHFLHGADDPFIPVADIRSLHGHLADLQGDATLDIASGVGHEMHEALVEQAVVRLQTCIPLRSWQEALGSLKEQGPAADDDLDLDFDDEPGKPGPTLH